MSSKDAGHSRLAVFGTVSFYMVAALAMVMANKWVLSTTDTPLFFLFSQLIIAILLFLASNALGLLIVPLQFDQEIVQGLIPMIALNVVGLSSSNYTLKYVDASYYQVARGMVLPFTVATSYVMLQSRPSIRILFACFLVTIGFFIGVFLDGESVSLVGISFGVMSSLITACHSVVIKRSLEVVKGSALNLSWYTNLYSAIILFPLVILAGEVPAIMSLFFGPVSPKSGLSALGTFLWGSAITGVFGFLMSIASVLSIKVTSPITHMVSSAVRGVAGAALGARFFSEVITSGRVSSVAIILGGSIYYTWIKHLETQHKPTGSAYDRVALDELEAGKRASFPNNRQASRQNSVS